MNIDQIFKFIERTAQQTVLEAKKQELQKIPKTMFQKTETLLYNYWNLKNSIDEQEKMIAELTEIPKKSKDIVYQTIEAAEDKDESEKLEEMIQGMRDRIKRTQLYLRLIDTALARVEDDEYYPIITMRYMDGRTYDEIAGFFECSEKTIRRNKNRLIGELQVLLFSDDVLFEILCS